MAHTSSQLSLLTIVLFVTCGLLFFISLCHAEVLIQDVLWSEEYDEGLQENYYGMCTFVPSPCGWNHEGVCVQRGKCAKHDGMWIGDYCEGGMGECCLFVDSCKTGKSYVDVRQLVTVLQTPENATTPCSIRIPKEPRICQVRVDFLDYLTQGADPDGSCKTDKLHIKNSITVDKDFTTCGILTGQHMYLTFNEEGDMLELTPVIRSLGSHYRIAITKIPCNSKNRVPDYCLQHYTGSSGMVQSFDFGRQQQNSQRYTICLKPGGHSSQVQWSPCGGVGNSHSFDIVSNFGAMPIECNKDWIQIKGLERTCEIFTQITSSWKPFEIMVNFDESEFPPLPPTFTKPITGPCDETNCYSEGAQMCACVASEPSPNTCVCAFDYTQVTGAPMPDLNNTGFCLEYYQE